MTRNDDPYCYFALVMTGVLIANTTSLFNAIAALLVMLPITALAGFGLKNRNTALRIVIAAAIGSTAASLLLLGIGQFAPAPQASDVVEAYGATVLLAVLAATGLNATATPAFSPFRLAGLLLATGAICEVLGYGVLLGDHEIAFAGATLAWRLPLLDFAPLPLAATPAGALGIAGLLYGVMQYRNCRTARTDNTGDAVISEPRRGRRVRVTGHIS